MTKLTYNQAMQRLHDERTIDCDDVLASALKRKVWIGMASFPGCLPESLYYGETKESVIEGLAGGDDDFRGRSNLRKHHHHEQRGMIYEINTITLKDAIG